MTVSKIERTSFIIPNNNVIDYPTGRVSVVLSPFGLVNCGLFDRPNIWTSQVVRCVFRRNGKILMRFLQNDYSTIK